MPEEYFDVAMINFDKAVLHGYMAGPRNEEGFRTRREVEQVLTEEQKKALDVLASKHDREQQKLLRSFVDAA